MQAHNVLKFLGLAMIIIGAILSQTIYDYYYPNDWVRTLTEQWPVLVCVVGGAALGLIGAKMGDGK